MLHSPSKDHKELAATAARFEEPRHRSMDRNCGDSCSPKESNATCQSSCVPAQCMARRVYPNSILWNEKQMKLKTSYMFIFRHKENQHVSLRSDLNSDQDSLHEEPAATAAAYEHPITQTAATAAVQGMDTPNKSKAKSDSSMRKKWQQNNAARKRQLRMEKLI